MPRSLPEKLQLRQMFGGDRRPDSWKPVKYYEKCPEHFQIPLQKISNYETFKDGHVYVGFSPDGKYLLSYQCKFNFHFMDSQTEICYTYTLHWWLFDLLQPIRKVREVQLFAHESIHYELHILICQPPDAEYIVVHGVTYSVDMHSNGKMTYVSIIPTDTIKHSIHLRYELLPPHPPFVTSISLKLRNVILLNSGDILFAILLDKYIAGDDSECEDNSDCTTGYCCYCQLMERRQKQEQEAGIINTVDNDNSDNNDKRILDEGNTIESSTSSDDAMTSNQKVANWHTQSDEEMFTDNIFSSPKIIKSHRNSQLLSQNATLYTTNMDTMQQLGQKKHFSNVTNKVDSIVDRPVSISFEDNCYASQSTSQIFNNNNLFNVASDLSRDNENITDELSGCNKEYVSYIVQGFSLPTEQGTQESLPASPFDCTTQVLPCHLSSLDGNEVLKHVYEHRCFRAVYKGTKDNCDYFIGQAQFDAENFVNEEIQLSKDISRRFVSMRDYDMQIIDLCEERKEVIILINALVVFRDNVQRDEKIPSMNTQVSEGLVQRESCYKLSLYTLGYIVSWNVYTGCVTVLKRYPIVEGPGTICKTRQFTPSLSQAVQLRKGFFVPTAKNASVQTLSNHTVFSGKSLQYLFNPLLPVAVVM